MIEMWRRMGDIATRVIPLHARVPVVIDLERVRFGALEAPGYAE